MEELLERCAGMDVHRDTVVVTIMVGFGKHMWKETRTFSTMTDGLRESAQWLKEHSITVAAIESTGIYWKPVFNVFEQEGVELTLANARHVKNVPGRKTDVKDSAWLCRLFKCGLIEKSFIPPAANRQLRDLTRYRTTLVQSLTSEKNRLIKMLESVNIKLASVFSDVFGKTAWEIIQAIVTGEENVDTLTANIHGRVKASKEDIKRALTGTIKEADRVLLKIMILVIADLEKHVEAVDGQIQANMKQFSKEAELLKTIPGVGDKAASVIIAEVGTHMDQFATSQHVTSWAGMAPGSNESAGKKKALESTQETIM